VCVLYEYFIVEYRVKLKDS